MSRISNNHSRNNLVVITIDELETDIYDAIPMEEKLSQVQHAKGHENDDESTFDISTGAREPEDPIENVYKLAFQCMLKRCLVWALYILYTIAKYGTGIVLIFILVLLIGSCVEKRAAERTVSTLSLYNTSDVCAMRNMSDNTVDFSTFPNSQDAHIDGYNVAHCGQCGHCSNLIDINIQAETSKTLKRSAEKCAMAMISGGSREVQECLEKDVGFTKPCEECWVANIQCTFRNCIFTCLKNKIFERGTNNRKDGSLNDCLQCDERMCGPQFLECSGSNRRRLGILSDIRRDAENEQCKSVDKDWNI